MRTLRLTLAVVLAAALPRPAAAQQPTRAVEYLGASTLRTLVDSLAATHAPGRVLGDRGAYSYLLLRRDTSGVPEVHADWADVLVVQSGTGTVVHGGRVTGGRDVGEGEWRGGTIVGGVRQRMGPGDVLIVPAGTPHQVVLSAGEQLAYLAVKIRAPADTTRATKP